MTGIVLIIILAIGYALCGDTSVIEAIGKGILYIALFLIFCGIIVYAPWLILVIICIVVILVFCSSNSTNNNMSNTTTNNQNNIYKSNTIAKPIENPTSFQSQLQQNSKTPQQVQTEQELKVEAQAKTSAQYVYSNIKKELLKKAENGNYTIFNGHKHINFDYKEMFNPSFIKESSKFVYINKTIFNPSGQIAREVLIYVSDKPYYNAYISEIKRLALDDGITVEPILLHKNTKMVYSLPFRAVGFGESTYNYEFVLRCTVQY